jgi:uncharacterized protein YodC (DUF2158 family)
MSFKVGDVVRLKSGSPKMTVEYIERTSTKISVHCIWWNENTNEFDREVFPADALKIDDGENKIQIPEYSPV